MKKNLINIITFVLICLALGLAGYTVMVNPLGLTKNNLYFLIQVVCVLIINTFLALTEIDNPVLIRSNIRYNYSKWLAIFLPMYFMLCNYDYNLYMKFGNLILFVVNFVLWSIFISSNSINIKSKRKLEISNITISVYSVWYLIGFVFLGGNNNIFHFAKEPLNHFESIHYLLSLKYLISISAGVGCFIYGISHFSFFPIPKIPKITLLSANMNNITSFETINAILIGFQFSLNNLIKLLNGIVLLIGAIIAYFFRAIRLVLNFIGDSLKIGLLILPSFLVLVILMLLIYFIRFFSVDIVRHIQINYIAESWSKLIFMAEIWLDLLPLFVFCCLSFTHILLIKIIYHYASYKKFASGIEVFLIAISYLAFALGFASIGSNLATVFQFVGGFTIGIIVTAIICIIAVIVQEQKSKRVKNVS